MKKLSGLGALVLISIALLSVLSSPVWAISDSWVAVKPYADTTYDETIGNSALGDWGQYQ